MYMRGEVGGTREGEEVTLTVFGTENKGVAGAAPREGEEEEEALAGTEGTRVPTTRTGKRASY